ncbi:MAG: GntR family transcriptional regulator [Vampirovibrio sp.]|nr:GntR family transcriptional regulator [Vampirovibrio sp.]
MAVRQTKTETSKTKKSGGALKKGGSIIEPYTQGVKDQDTGTKYSDLQNISKSSLQRIEINQLPKECPDFRTPGITKDSLIMGWLIEFIETALKKGEITENHLLPRKDDIAKYLGVSVGTVQNAIRLVEDEGHVESKQRIGTLVRDASNSEHRMRKLTSKRDQAVVAVKRLIVERGFKPGESLPSAREIATLIGSAPNTTRLALEFLANQGTLKSRGTRGNKANWEMVQMPELTEQDKVTAIESETLIDQLERDLKDLIQAQFEVGDKLPSNLELSSTLKVSIKTVHDAMKRLADQGIINSKRGRYGTYVLRKPDTSKLYKAGEDDIFVPAQEASFYNYEKVEGHLKLLIKENYKVGDKMPSMGQLADQLDVSSNTIRKALQNLAKHNYVTFTRGRYGGTFVQEIPEVKDAKAYAWVSINPETVRTYRSTTKEQPAN